MEKSKQNKTENPNRLNQLQNFFSEYTKLKKEIVDLRG